MRAVSFNVPCPTAGSGLVQLLLIAFNLDRISPLQIVNNCQKYRPARDSETETWRIWGKEQMDTVRLSEELNNVLKRKKKKHGMIHICSSKWQTRALGSMKRSC